MRSKWIIRIWLGRLTRYLVVLSRVLRHSFFPYTA